LVREVLSRIPDRRSADDFEADYRQQVVALLDHMEFFGATLSESSRRPLTATAPFAGMTDLTIIVAPDQDYRRAELLGPGSSVGVTG
jgi:hypothetical protein